MKSKEFTKIKNGLRDKTFLQLCKVHGLKEPEREFKFHEKRKWRFDFAFPLEKIAIEVQGGIFLNKSGHNTGLGLLQDYEKYNNAVILGWRVLQINSPDLNKVETMEMIKKIFENKEMNYSQNNNLFEV